MEKPILLTQKMIDHMIPVFYEFFLTLGDNGVVDHIIESGVEVMECPKVKKKIDRRLKTKNAESKFSPQNKKSPS